MMPLNEYVISKSKRWFLTQAATSGLRSSSKASLASDPHRLKQPKYLGHDSVSIIFSGRGFHPLLRERQTELLGFKPELKSGSASGLEWGGATIY
jgi:hypothetical protein